MPTAAAFGLHEVYSDDAGKIIAISGLAATYLAQTVNEIEKSLHRAGLMHITGMPWMKI